MNRFAHILVILIAPGLLIAGASNSRPAPQTGLATFYDDDLQGNRTASNERYNKNEFVAAHPTYPPGTIVKVTNLQNGRSINVRIIDRGPTHQNRREGVIIDLSRRAAEQLAFIKAGRTRVRVHVIKWGTAAQKQ
jgi:rare lipoprotein A